MTPGVLLALCSALVWGSGDFCGGRAAARHDPFQVLGLSAIAGIALLASASLVFGERVQAVAPLLWSAAAGVAGALGIAALYRGLAIGRAATVAPLAAVVAAACPVVFAAVVEGPPRPAQVAGFFLALTGIWLVSRSAAASGDPRGGVRMGALAGLGFGGFLILIAQVPHESVFVPLLVARIVMLVVAVVVLTWRQTAVLPSSPHPVAFAAGILDAGGNILYLLAQHLVRIDVAGVLSSLYPVATVMLSRVIVRERISTSQWIGAAVCLVAVVLITS
jgi:drug/metabolite transporter (DMT)-like permease